MIQLTTKNALICYGLGIATAIAGWFNNGVLVTGWVILFIISLIQGIEEG